MLKLSHRFLTVFDMIPVAVKYHLKGVATLKALPESLSVHLKHADFEFSIHAHPIKLKLKNSLL